MIDTFIVCFVTILMNDVHDDKETLKHVKDAYIGTWLVVYNMYTVCEFKPKQI